MENCLSKPAHESDKEAGQSRQPREGVGGRDAARDEDHTCSFNTEDSHTVTRLSMCRDEGLGQSKGPARREEEEEEEGVMQGLQTTTGDSSDMAFPSMPVRWASLTSLMAEDQERDKEMQSKPPGECLICAAPTSTQGPSSTEGLTSSQRPSSTEGLPSSQRPSSTEGPPSSQRPSSTEGPPSSQRPSSTEGPPSSQRPSSTEGPPSSQRPSSTEGPPSSQRPSSTEGPPSSQRPSSTEGPPSSQRPSSTEGLPSSQRLSSTVGLTSTRGSGFTKKLPSSQRPSSTEGLPSSQRLSSTVGLASTRGPGSTVGLASTRGPGSTVGLASTRGPGSTVGLASTRGPGSTKKLPSSQRPRSTEGLPSSQRPRSTEGLPSSQRPRSTEGLPSSQRPSSTEGLPSSQRPSSTEGLPFSQRPRSTEELASTRGSIQGPVSTYSPYSMLSEKLHMSSEHSTPGSEDSERTEPTAADIGTFGPNQNSVVCLPLVSEGLKLIWTPLEQSRDLDGIPQLVEAFNAFPYPSLQEIASLARRCALPLDRVKVWFMVQRIRYGISWASEEIEETRSKLRGLLLLHQQRQQQQQQLEDEEVAARLACRMEGWEEGGDRHDFWMEEETADVFGQAISSPAFPYKFGVEYEISGSQTHPNPCYREARLRVAPSPLFMVAPPSGRTVRQYGRPKKSKAQLTALRRSFVRGNWPSELELQRLQEVTGLHQADIRKWFSDSRYQLRNNGRAGAGVPRGRSQNCVQLRQEGVNGGIQSRPLEESARRVAAVSGLGKNLRSKVKEEAEDEDEGIPTMKGDLDDASPATAARGRLRKKTKEQLDTLKQHFLRCQWPSGEDYTRLVALTGLPRHDIIQWYGDTRYAVKNGQVRWVKGEIAQQQQQHPDVAAGRWRTRRPNENQGALRDHSDLPQRNVSGGTDARLLVPGARVRGEEDRGAGDTANLGTDIRPLEMYWRQTGALRDRDLGALCLTSRMSHQQVRDWFLFQESGMAEVEVNISD